MNTSDFRTTGAVWTEEPEEDHANTATSETRMQDDDTELAEATLDRWDQDKWAENIMKQGFLQESKPKLQRRISDFLARTSATQRQELETGRARLLEVMKAAQFEQETRYPESADKSRQTRRERAQAKIRAGYKTFSEATYEYSKIMDMLVSQAPEYVALAWGAIKIVLVIQINHEELKQKVKDYMEQIKLKFEMIDHLTDFIPRENLVAAVAKVYELFSRFLAKAVKYYSMNMSKARTTAFFKPWKVNLQGIVDAIDQAFADIKDISHFHGLLEGHASLGLGRENLHNIKISVKMHEESLERLDGLEQMMQQIQAMVVSFSKEVDVQQTANFLRKCVNETLEEPEQSRKPHGQDETIQEHEGATGHTPDPYREVDAKSLLNDLFVELREFRQDASRRETAIEQTSEMRDHRSKRRNIMRIEEVMGWAESESSRLLWINGHNVLRRSVFTTSFAVPLLVLGESNCETTLVLRHFCGDSSVYETGGCRILVQALLYQILEQHPEVFDRKKASLTREATSTLTTLWNLFLDCLAEVSADCTFIIIENINVLRTPAESNFDEGKFIIQRLHALIQDSTKLIKILLVASLARDQASSSEGRSVLMLTQRRESMSILENELALVSHKLIEIQQKRCKSITFAEITMLYVPNTTVYTTEDDELRAFVIVELSGMEPRSFESYNPLRMRAWTIDHDGQNVARRYYDLTVSQFSGQKEIKCLQYIPAGFLPSESEKRRNLIARGKLWWTYSFGIHHVTTDRYKTQAMIDQRRRDRATDLPKFSPFLKILSAATLDTLKPLYLLLCPPLVDAFILQEMKWATIKVFDIEPYRYDTHSFDRMVLPDGHAHKLKAVCQGQMMGATSNSSKQPTGGHKNGGLVIAICGGPGVGKTLASEYTKRPLLSVSTIDMAAKADAFEKTLQNTFKLAESWNTNIVFQKADVFLSTMRGGDIVHNNMVSAFLRFLDQFHGILILLAKKVEVLDSSLQPRIQVSLLLPTLHKAKRSMFWDQLFGELEVNRKDLRVDPEVREYLDEDSQLTAFNWNGKRMRNILQTAVALAEKDALDEALLLGPASC
ncbi:MAG: hypothetical protein ASARMPRED_003927 [Alectoria sarmentosa]|nr:MAG: hypothetical protein ASARMPRED_003927 [Alectoria sarmentosa]